MCLMRLCHALMQPSLPTTAHEGHSHEQPPVQPPLFDSLYHSSHINDFRSERKVLNKYFPPDFDPSKVPRRKIDREAQVKVRLMAPFSMQCTSCGDYIYKGKKFNARKEHAIGEAYLGIRIYRFYIRCPKCAAEITFKTDPKNKDYVAEHGAQRNFEPWRDESTVEEEMAAERTTQEENNPMRALENRTVESKREMDILDALDEIQTKNAHIERVGAAEAATFLAQSTELQLAELQRREEEEIDRIARAIFKNADGETIRRIEDDDEDAPFELDEDMPVSTRLERPGPAVSDTKSSRDHLGVKTHKSLLKKPDTRLLNTAATLPVAKPTQDLQKLGPSNIGIRLKKSTPVNVVKAKPVEHAPKKTALVIDYPDSDED